MPNGSRIRLLKASFPSAHDLQKGPVSAVFANAGSSEEEIPQSREGLENSETSH